VRFFDFVSIRLTLGLVVGIVSGFYLEIHPQIPFYAILALLPFLYWANKKQARKRLPFFELITLFLTILLGAFILNLASTRQLAHHYSKINVNGVGLWEIKIREVLKPNSFSQRYVANVLSLENKEVSGKLIMNIPIDSASKKLKVDDEFFIIARLENINPPLNPHQFNYKDFLKKQSIYHQIRVRSNQFLQKKSASTTILGLAANFREHIILKLKSKNFGKDELGVIQALLLGQRDDISESTYNSYRDAGAIHILAVSGLHVGILLLLFQFILLPLERLPKGKTIKLVSVVSLLWIYAFIAGLSPSIVRAVTMFTFVAYAMYLNRPTNSFNIVALSMFFILLVNPLFLFQVGFQMSYAAVLSIAWIYPKLQRFWYPDTILARKTWQLFSVSVAAQLGVLPISLYYFHQFPALFFVSNLLVIPFLGIILGLGILIIALSLIDLLPHFLVETYNIIIKIMNLVISWVAQQERFVIRDIPFDTVQLFLAYALIISLVLFLSKPKWKNILAFMAALMTLQVWAIWNQLHIQQKEILILAHQNRNTLLLHQKALALRVYVPDSISGNQIIRDFAIAERIPSTSHHSLQYHYGLNKKNLYIMDSLAIYPVEKEVDFLLLTQSPKINLERLVDAVHPKMILADGSNYKSYISRWKQTCLEKEIPFHCSGEKGFYVFDLD